MPEQRLLSDTQSTIGVQEQRLSFLQEQEIEINKKVIRVPFQVSMPNTSSDFAVICDVLEPNFISEEMSDYDSKEFVSAIAYKINEHDTIRREYVKHFGQTSLIAQKLGYRMLEYMDKTKLKLIDPNTEFLRIGDRKRFSGFVALDPPEYLKEYLLKRKSVKEDDSGNKFEAMHAEFWRSLFLGSKISGRQPVAHFISWFRESSTKRKSDKFVPPVPYIKNTSAKNELIKYTKEINHISYELYGDESAFYVIFDMDLFRDLESIEQIASIISEAKNTFIIIKILGIKKVNEVGFGDYAKRNLEYFLKVLNDIKSVQSNKLIGLLDGGGFSFCLMGIVDFFTDTVGNYPQDSFKRYREARHRGLLHPRTYTVEPIEGVVQHQKEHDGSLFHDNSIADLYRGVDISKTDRSKWSLDARKIGLIFWQKRMWSLINTERLGWSKMRFDEIVNSDYPVLGKIVMRVMNGQ